MCQLKKLRARTSTVTQSVVLAGVLMFIGVIVLAVLADVLTHTRALTLQLLAAGVLLSILAAAVMGWIGKIRQGSLLSLARAADRIRTGEISAHMPRLGDDAEMQTASLSLQRMLDAFRQQIQALQAENAALQGRIENRTRELTTLAELSHDLSTKTDVESLMQDTLKALEKAVDYSAASIWGRRDDGIALLSHRFPNQLMTNGNADKDAADLTGTRLSSENARVYEQIEQEHKPVVVNRIRRNVLAWLWSQLLDDAGTSKLYKASRSWMAVPLQTHDQMLGIMRVDHEQPDFFDAERERLLNAIGDQAGLALHHAQLQTQARQFAVMTERTRIARDLHDAVSQTLFAANVLVGTLRKTVHSNPSLAQTQLIELQRLNKGALAEMRLMMFELRPDTTEKADVGELLRQAVDAVSSRTGIPVVVYTDSGTALPAAIKMQLYRIAQEALSNMARHSGATQLTLEFHCVDATRCLLRIADNGCGFDPAQERPGHFGLGNMRERALEIGADFSIHSQPAEGTDITVVWPQETVAPNAAHDDVVSTLVPASQQM